MLEPGQAANRTSCAARCGNTVQRAEAARASATDSGIQILVPGADSCPGWGRKPCKGRSGRGLRRRPPAPAAEPPPVSGSAERDRGGSWRIFSSGAENRPAFESSADRVGAVEARPTVRRSARSGDLARKCLPVDCLHEVQLVASRPSPRRCRRHRRLDVSRFDGDEAAARDERLLRAPNARASTG